MMSRLTIDHSYVVILRIQIFMNIRYITSELEWLDQES